MRKYSCSPFGDLEVDLDNPKTYEHLPQNTKDGRAKMLEIIGYSFCYMNLWHKDIYGIHTVQKERV
jgi:hypothetical protein